jgi:hypothetical protein
MKTRTECVKCPIPNIYVEPSCKQWCVTSSRSVFEATKTQETSRIGIPVALEQEARMRACPTSRVALVIEDEWLVRATIVSELKERGYRGRDRHRRRRSCSSGWPRSGCRPDRHPVGRSHERVGRRSCGPHGESWPPGYLCLCQRIRPLKGVAGSLFFGKPYDPADVVAACHRLTAAE